VIDRERLHGRTVDGERHRHRAGPGAQDLEAEDLAAGSAQADDGTIEERRRRRQRITATDLGRLADDLQRRAARRRIAAGDQQGRGRDQTAKRSAIVTHSYPAA
jgi:hypothetical protein